MNITPTDIVVGLCVAAALGVLITAFVDLFSTKVHEARCSYCQRIYRAGKQPATHGVCDTCLPDVEKAWENADIGESGPTRPVEMKRV